MISTSLLPLKVTWQEPGVLEDEYGNEQPDWSEDARTDHENVDAYIEQRDTTELVDGRTTVVSRRFLIANELGFGAGDRIVHGGVTYEIDGDSAILQTPSGPHHSESMLKLVSG